MAKITFIQPDGTRQEVVAEPGMTVMEAARKELEQVLGGVPLWVAILMGLIAITGTLGMIWLIYIFSRAPVSPDGGDEE